MRDHTYNGTPVRRMSIAKILDLLKDGAVEILNSDGLTDKEACAWVMLRLEVELIIRSILGETH